jgi:glutaredoxin
MPLSVSNAQELAHDLDGEHLGVGELGCRSTASDAPSFELVIYEAEDSYDEGVKIHKKKTSTTSPVLFGSTPSVGGSSVSLKSSKELAHGVS